MRALWWTIFVRNGGKAHIDQLLLTNLNYEWQGCTERRGRACNHFTLLALNALVSYRPPDIVVGSNPPQAVFLDEDH